MKLLSICVPTYNRVRDFQSLYLSFLTKALDCYGEHVEVVICDNSEIDKAKLNQRILDERVRYFRNEVNIGFSGNFIRCVNESMGRFIWIISDNDPVIWEGFEDLMAALPIADNDSVDCLMLPFQTRTPHGDVVYSNRYSDWGVEVESNTLKLIATNQLPFVLFSGAVLRVDRTSFHDVVKAFSKNDYIQTVVFMSMLSPDSKIRFTQRVVLDYQPEYIGRLIGVSSMSRSMLDVRKFIEQRFGTRADYGRDYRGWLLWLLHHRSGIYNIPYADKERWDLLSKLVCHFGAKNLLLAIAILLPKRLIQPIFLFYKSIGDAKRIGKLSLGEVKSRLSIYRRFIRKTHG